jgi:hypothetical protein
MAWTEEEIRSYIEQGEDTKEEKDSPEEEIRRDNPKDFPFRQNYLYTRKEAWDVYKAYTTSVQTMSGKGDGEREQDPDGIYSTDC